MDGVTLASKVAFGYAKSALYTGTAFSQYRATTSANPTASGNLIGTLKALFSTRTGARVNLDKAPDHKDPQRQVLIDYAGVLNPTVLKPGDYLTNGTLTYFIAAMDALMSPLAILCNGTVTVWQPGSAAPATGAVPRVGLALSYAGSVENTTANAAAGTANETAVMTNWPASILLGARGRKEIELPGDAGIGAWQIRMPVWPGVNIRPSYYIGDANGNRYAVQGAEISEFGWVINAIQEIP